MPERAMYIWKLKPVLVAEGGVGKVVEKAVRAKLSALWIKVAEGQSPYGPNVGPSISDDLKDLVDRCHKKGIAVWGWHVPRCPTANAAAAEASVFAAEIKRFDMDGLIMDAEGGDEFFQGGVDVAKAYAERIRAAKQKLGKPLALSSHDIPKNIAGWLPKFNEFAAAADVNFPQVYYGGSPSVAHRLDRAEDGNAHLSIPFVPVGAAWIGDGGGCSSASACAERAREFIRLVKERGHPGYAFWHWSGAPTVFWEVLNTVAA